MDTILYRYSNKTLDSGVLPRLLPIFHKKTSRSRDKVINPVQTCVGIHTNTVKGDFGKSVGVSKCLYR